MKPIQLFIAALAGALSTATMIAVATPPKFEQQVEPPMMQISTIYTCQTMPEYDTNEAAEIRDLRRECETEKQVVLLITQWQKDPQAGIVYE